MDEKQKMDMIFAMTLYLLLTTLIILACGTLPT
jgi:hypothetical protein